MKCKICSQETYRKQNYYYNLYKLKHELGNAGKLQPAAIDKIDTDSLAGIQTTKHWDTKDKEKAIDVLSKIEKQEQQAQ